MGKEGNCQNIVRGAETGGQGDWEMEERQTQGERERGGS